MLADLLKEKKIKSAVEGNIDSTDMYCASLMSQYVTQNKNSKQHISTHQVCI